MRIETLYKKNDMRKRTQRKQKRSSSEKGDLLYQIGKDLFADKTA